MCEDVEQSAKERGYQKADADIDDIINAGVAKALKDFNSAFTELQNILSLQQSWLAAKNNITKK